MLTDRMRLLSSDLYDYVFRMVDGENEAFGNDAGRIATAVQKEFECSVLSGDPDALADRIIVDAQRDGTIEYGIEDWPEEVSVRGNALASGDDEEDERAENEILDALDRGNRWAWCTVRVTCRIPGYDAIGDDWLGCCSFTNRAAFEEAYYDGMRANARRSLKSELSKELGEVQ